MAFHDISSTFQSSRFWVFAAAASSRPVRPQADCSRLPLDAEPSGTAGEADPREPEWQGQWRLLKYL